MRFEVPKLDDEYEYLEDLDAENLSLSMTPCNSSEIELQRFTISDDNLLKFAERGEFCLGILHCTHGSNYNISNFPLQSNCI